MKRILSSFVAIVCLSGCIPSVAHKETVIATANSFFPVLTSIYDNQQTACLAQFDTKPEALACVESVREAWKPIWTAWDALQVASDVDVAWCSLMREIAAKGIKIPNLAEVKCE